jgi:hypothetical protein
MMPPATAVTAQKVPTIALSGPGNPYGVGVGAFVLLMSFAFPVGIAAPSSPDPNWVMESLDESESEALTSSEVELLNAFLDTRGMMFFPLLIEVNECLHGQQVIGLQ